MYYKESPKKVNTLEKNSEKISEAWEFFGDETLRPGKRRFGWGMSENQIRAVEMLPATLPGTAEADPPEWMRESAPDGGRSAVVCEGGNPPKTNRGVESSQIKKLPLLRSSTGAFFYGGFDGQSAVTLWGDGISDELRNRLDGYLADLWFSGQSVLEVELGGLAVGISRPPRGRIGYSYKLSVAGCEVLLHKTPSATVPAGKIVYGWKVLERVHPKELTARLIDWLVALGVEIQTYKLQRVDMQVTLAKSRESFLSALRERRYICHARKFALHGEGTRDQTFSLGGHGSAVMFRCYDKGAELAEGPDREKEQLIRERFEEADALGGGGWFADLTRFEFELRRDFLAGFKIDTWEDLEASENAVAEYLTCNWLRLTSSEIDRKNKHQSRAETLADWREVQECFLMVFRSGLGSLDYVAEEKPILLDKKEEKKSVKSSVGFMARAVASAAVRAGVKEWHQTIDFIERLGLLSTSLFDGYDLARRVHDRIEEYLQRQRFKAIPEGWI